LTGRTRDAPSARRRASRQRFAKQPSTFRQRFIDKPRVAGCKAMGYSRNGSVSVRFPGRMTCGAAARTPSSALFGRITTANGEHRELGSKIRAVAAQHGSTRGQERGHASLMATVQEIQRRAARVLRMRVTGAGHAIYAGAVAGLGGLLLSGRFVYIYAPLPKWVPGRTVLAGAWGALMLLSAVALLWRKTVVSASAAVALSFLGWLLLLQLPRIITAPSNELLWSGAAQISSLVAGGWFLFASSASPAEGPGRWLGGSRGVRWARWTYALALPMFGLHHFLANGATQAVPAWLPFRVEWLYLTGAAHIAAGIALLLGIVPRLAATLEAIMIGAFVLLVHVPGVIGAPGDRLQWTMLVDACAIGGAAWIAAASWS
jgi:uncharacterized membrane protein